ncbi:MAG: hypothetical protein ACI8RD_011221, partial [Bacillariaceae sp.]
WDQAAQRRDVERTSFETTPFLTMSSLSPFRSF